MQRKIYKYMSNKLDFSFIDGSVILITGATGLIGKTLIKRLIKYDVHLIAVVRNIQKAKTIFFGYDSNKLSFINSDILELIPKNMGIDYIIHTACVTSSKLFIEKPTEVIRTTVVGTDNILRMALCNNIKKFIFLSSMEVYGTPVSDEKIIEEHCSNIDTMNVRSCYPESKRLAENLCSSYCKEFNIPICVIRLTQTFGPGVLYEDNRVFAEFARCIIEKRDIILHTKGETKRNYLYTEDAVDAILTVLKKGVPGEAYNAANEDTYCSIAEMAQFVVDNFGNGISSIKYDFSTNPSLLGYAPQLKMNLSCEKLNKLGWHANTDMYTMYKEMIKEMMDGNNK